MQDEYIVGYSNKYFSLKLLVHIYQNKKLYIKTYSYENDWQYPFNPNTKSDL